MRAAVFGVGGVFAGILLFALWNGQAATPETAVSTMWARYLGCVLQHGDAIAEVGRAYEKMREAETARVSAALGLMEAVEDGRVPRSEPVAAMIEATHDATSATRAWIRADVAEKDAHSHAAEALADFADALERGGVVVDPAECQG